MLKPKLKTPGIKACQCPLPPGYIFWSLLGAENTREMRGDQNSSCNACSAFTGMWIKSCPEEPICSAPEEIIMALRSPVGRQRLFCPVQLALSLFAIRVLWKPFDTLSYFFMVFNCSFLLVLYSFQIDSICISIKVLCITPPLMAPCFLIFLPRTFLQ